MSTKLSIDLSQRMGKTFCHHRKKAPQMRNIPVATSLSSFLEVGKFCRYASLAKKMLQTKALFKTALK
jgi:hypothetical protein